MSSVELVRPWSQRPDPSLVFVDAGEDGASPGGSGLVEVVSTTSRSAARRARQTGASTPTTPRSATVGLNYEFNSIWNCVLHRPSIHVHLSHHLDVQIRCDCIHLLDYHHTSSHALIHLIELIFPYHRSDSRYLI